MLNHLRPLIEAEAAQRGRQTLVQIRFFRTRNKMLWALAFASVLMAFVVVLSSVIAGETHAHSVAWLAGGTTVAAIIVAITERLRHDLSFVHRLAILARSAAQKLRFATRLDFLTIHAWTAYSLVLGPTLLACVLLWLRSTGIVKPGTNDYKAYSDVLKQLITSAAALLAVQIALFNFMFGQLLGKYSSAIAVTVGQHRVVRLLRIYSVGLLILLYWLYLLGFPDALPRVAFLLVLSLAVSVLITVWVSNAGVAADRAIVYFGHHNAKRIARSIKQPIFGYSPFWKVMVQLGLDWRSAERMAVTVPPEGPASRATSLAAGLFNAAHKSIQENQHETFLASLQALAQIAEGYVSKRREYPASTDHFLEYLNNQLAAVAKAATNALNESMVTNAVTFIGIIGAKALEVGRIPGQKKKDYPESHPSFAYWQNLLTECFQLTHTLMRSTAASEVLTQLSQLAKRAVELGYGENASSGFLAAIKQIYTTCLLKRDPYHLSLATECLVATLDLWNACLNKEAAAIAGVNESMCEAIKDMALTFQTIEKLPSLILKDPASVLTTKLSEEQITLQDIAISLVATPATERWQRLTVADGFGQILTMVSELAKDSAEKNLSFAGPYTAAFYEIALVILLGLPSNWNEPEDAEDHFRPRPMPVQEMFEGELISKIKELLPLYRRARNVVHDWEQELFSVIGVAAAVFNETKRRSLWQLAVGAITYYRELIAESVRNDDKVRDDEWDYVQLTSVWARHLLENDTLADVLVDDVANGRPFRSGMFGHGGKSGWGLYGYPNVSFLHSDFSIANPRNIANRLGDSVWQTLKRWQDRLMNPAELRDTYERVQRIREPIRKRLIEDRKKRTDARRQSEKPGAAEDESV